ncbi:SDR family oxidoreductase [Paralimibaculum aggregatum]|uniref:SDR family oxidoreductase n=1 Tax=Paralimibaculum aggregatum TaxID=3036245 RepID=A0ABQ6LPF7_9RHOB|nr:SDR family oxidoreductase [Limibaculum sp. NKW23]GMG84927.1 SDR family oxidoreductase [Limibaculum sp. NKW23]
MTTRTLLSLGHGYSAQALSRRLAPQGWRIIGTTRSAAKAEAIRASGAEPLLWPGAPVAEALAAASHLLVSAAPGPEGDPVLAALGPEIAAAAPRLAWAGYLSTTGVYGDRAGGWVDEGSDCRPATARGRARLAAERAWGQVPGLPLHIFRLAGIYGPGRGPFAKVRAGTARCIVKPGQVFSRIHVADIASALAASIARPNPGAVYNICDDEAAPPEAVIAHAARLLGLPPPPDEPFESAAMTPMARSFYAESKRVSNARLREELGVALAYPSYREGLAALLAAENAENAEDAEDRDITPPA